MSDSPGHASYRTANAIVAAVYWTLSSAIFAVLTSVTIAAPLVAGLMLVRLPYFAEDKFMTFIAVGLASLLALVCVIRSLSTSFSRFGNLPGMDVTNRAIVDNVQEVCDSLGVRRFKKIRVIGCPECATLHAPGGRVLLLGIPNIRYLTSNELRAVVAHECAHYHHGAMLVCRAHCQNLLWFEGIKHSLVLSGQSSDEVFRGTGYVGGVAYLLMILSAVVMFVLLLLYSLYLRIVGRFLPNAEYEFYCDAVACRFAGDRVFASALQKTADLGLADFITSNEGPGGADYLDALERVYHSLRETNPPIRKESFCLRSGTHPSDLERTRRFPKVPGVPDATSPIFTEANAGSAWASLLRHFEWLKNRG